MIEIPEEFASSLVRREGEPARQWLSRVPELFAKYLEVWDLRPDGAPMHGAVGLVLPVRGADESPAALKLSLPSPETEHEWLTLSTWDGRGAVRLLDHGAGDSALLLERLDADRSLEDIELDEAVRIAGELLRRQAVPAPPEIRTLAGLAERWAEEFAAETRIPRRLLDAGIEVCTQLGPVSRRLIVNQDLHFENVLAGEREPWLVIDPKAVAGDPEFGLTPLLWNQFDGPGVGRRLAALVDAAGLDLDLARAWTLVSALENWTWALDTEGEQEMADMVEVIAHTVC
ncbi:streptomycin 6-kinase [Kutzneria viridogrisea]|uniref:Streptomycin 6-kinase n=1 Tax=Kutzneria viridogrisea TaxID=47990 RepID=A0ABR6BSZ9_9PSEU|nr:streptomycin 6-kinase [Kutzneria viridogrisea]